MVKLMIDESLPGRLTGLGECAELCDGAGKTVGFFTPSHPQHKPPLQPRVSDEELDRRAAAARANPESTFTTEQVKAHLRRL